MDDSDNCSRFCGPQLTSAYQGGNEGGVGCRKAVASPVVRGIQDIWPLIWVCGVYTDIIGISLSRYVGLECPDLRVSSELRDWRCPDYEQALSIVGSLPKAAIECLLSLQPSGQN